MANDLITQIIDAQRELNVTPEEIVRIRNTTVGKDYVQIWSRMLLTLCDAARALQALPVSATGIGYTDEQIAAAVQAWFGDTDPSTPVSKDFINRMRKALLAALEAQLAEARVEAAQPHATAHGLTMKPEQGES